MTKLILVLVLILTAIGCSGRQLTENDASESAMFKTAGEIDYFKPMEGAPIEFGMAYGNTFESDQGTLGKFPGHFKMPLHTHSNSYHAVVILGQITNPMQGETDKVKTMAPFSILVCSCRTSAFDGLRIQ
ncbi:MAG: hypothetical protein ACI845_002384 [Gammaproteobacteria bacterium]|jgi:hypothetical protein